jgi:hypothetical protein
MPFITKLDFSNNRQVKQNIETNTSLSGSTTFGVPFSYLPTGASPTTSAVTISYSGLVSTFSGNSGNTIYTWYDNSMNLALSRLSALTPTISATTQNTGIVFTPATSTTTVDGNLVNLTYTGVSFDLVPISFYNLGSGNYSGSVHTNILEILNAGALDYSGRTIWVDVSGVTRTKELIVTKNPGIGYALICVDAEGRVAFGPVSGASTSYWTSGSGTGAIYVISGGNAANGDYSLAEGYATTANGDYSHVEGSYNTAIGDNSHAGGSQSTASGNTSFVHGSGSNAGGSSTIVLGDGIIGTQSNYTYVESLNIKTVGSSAFANDIRIAANGNLTTNTSDERLKENILPLTDSLNKIKQLNGVSYQWKDRSAGGDDIRIGFIAQQVESVEPLLVFTNKVDSYKGIHIDSIIPMLVEAVKELSSGSITNTNTYIETQSIIAEDNNIDLNYDGNTQTAIGGGIRVLHALGQDISAELLIDSEGNWVTNNDLKPNALTVPVYTPKSSLDSFGNEGNITRDDNFMYVKTSMGWRRSNLESF